MSNELLADMAQFAIDLARHRENVDAAVERVSAIAARRDRIGERRCTR